MNYTKIIEIANKCEIIKQQRWVLYQALGKTTNLTSEHIIDIHSIINDLDNDLKKLEEKLVKLIQ